MADTNILAKRYAAASTLWLNWRSIYYEAFAYTIPQKNPWPQYFIPGVRKNISVYDITAVTATRRLVSRLHSSLVPPGEQWFELEAGQEVQDPNAVKDLNQELQLYTKIIFRALNDSNFDLVINEFIQDLTIGTAGLMILEGEGDKLLKFKSVGMDVIYPEGDAFDDIETVWRDFKDVCGADILRVWPKAKLTSSIQQRYESDKLAKFNFIEGVVYQPNKKNYRHCVWEMGCDYDYILDIESKSSPWIVARWSKASNEVGGRGPVLDAMPTIRSLNRLVEDILRNVGLSTSPPWMAASDGVFNPYLFEIEPNKIIPISRQSMGDLPLQKLDVSGDIRTGTLELQDLRQQVKDCLFDNPVRPVDSPAQTATEIMIRQQTFMEEIGPAFGRLSVEMLPKIINRVIFILQKKGYLPDALKVDSKMVNIRYKSPLVRSAQVQKIQNLQNYNSIMQSLVGPQFSMGTMNLQLVPAWLGNSLDVEEQLIKSPAEIAELITNLQASAAPQPPGENSPTPNDQMAAVATARQAQGSTTGAQ